jgi:hypothetical protein
MKINTLKKKFSKAFTPSSPSTENTLYDDDDNNNIIFINNNNSNNNVEIIIRLKRKYLRISKLS